jgi:hypothetical protein
MTFKYQSYHEKIDCQCPPLEKYEPTIRTCYRWVHEDINHNNNFLPPQLIGVEKEPADCVNFCGNLALSFFNTIENAEKRYLSLWGKIATFPETVGNSIAEGVIYERDGIASRPSKKTGHFDLHEASEVTFTGRFKVIKRIKL